MSAKLKPYVLPLYVTRAATPNVRSMLDDVLAEAHAHYEAQVGQLGGLARPDDDGPTIAQMEAGAQALRECGLSGSRESLMATADSVWRAMQEVHGAPVRDAHPDGEQNDDSARADFYRLANAFESECGHKPAHFDVFLMARGLMTTNGRRAVQPDGDAAMPVDCWRTPEGSAWSHEQGAHGRGTACTVALVTQADAQAALAAKDAVIERLRAEHDPAQVDMLAVCNALGFDPTNHHNAAKCPYCRPAQRDTASRLESLMAAVSDYGTACAAEGLIEHRRGHESQAGYPEYDLPAMLSEIEASARKLAGGA
jgi:hypothetical protein